jgi:hypothetical protein
MGFHTPVIHYWWHKDSQIPGIDYFDTFAPVARLASIRTVLAFVATKNLKTSQIDIKGAYLNGELTAEETIYMCQPPGYQQGTMVCQLQKTLYGERSALASFPHPPAFWPYS